MGPGDDDEILELAKEVSVLQLLGKKEEAADRLVALVDQYPKSHLLRDRAIVALNSVGRIAERDSLLMRSLAIYPSSPVLFSHVSSFCKFELLPEEMATIEAKINRVWRECGLRDAVKNAGSLSSFPIETFEPELEKTLDSLGVFGEERAEIKQRLLDHLKVSGNTRPPSR